MRALASWLVLFCALAGIPPGLAASDGGSELLTNPGFEAWGATGPVGWVGPATQAPGDSGFAALLSGNGVVELAQVVPAVPNATYHAEVRSKLQSGDATVSLRLEFYGSTPTTPLDSVFVQESAFGEAFRTLAVERVAPVGTAWISFRVRMNAPTGAEVLVDSASLQVVADPESPTPTTTPTQRPSPTSPTSPTTHTRTPTPTPTRTSTPPPATPTPPTSTPPRTGTPTPPKTGGEWGLLTNGGFESVSGGQPIGWAKNGGTLGVSANAAAGSWAATLHSATASTKWIHQAVPVTGGEWYRVGADARVASGKGTVFLRIAWYKSHDGSGAMMASVEGDATEAAQWTRLAAGPIQAPREANSARVRLMLRPASDDVVIGAFDNVVFEPTEAPPDPIRVPLLAADMVSGGERKAAGAAVPVAVRAQTGAQGLRISEFASDPVEPGRDTAYEWVELQNTGPDPIDLAGWLLGDANEMDELPAYVVPPGGFVVIAASSASFAADVPVVRVPDGDIGRGLNNTGDVIRLVAPGGIEADAVSYGDNASVNSPAPPAPDAGQTLGRDETGAWRLTSRATPGGPNEFAAAPARTPQNDPQPRRASSPAADPGEGETQTQDRVEVVESADGGSPVPWILLGAAGGAGAVASALGVGRMLARREQR